MVKQLHGVDSLFLRLDTKNAQMGLSTVFVYDPTTAEGGKLSSEQIIKHLHHSFGLLPILRCHLDRMFMDMDNPYLAEDPNFEMSRHINQVTLPAPGNREQLREQIQTFHAQPLDTERPLWEVLLIEGVGKIDGLPEGGFVIVLKVHHAIADGATLVQLATVLHDEGLEKMAKAPPLPSDDLGAPHLWEKMGRFFSNHMYHSTQMMAPLMKAGPKLGMTLMSKLMKPMGALPKMPVKTRFNHRVGDQRCWDFAHFPLDQFKQVAKSVPDATINDVALAVIAGALQRYLKGKNEPSKLALRAIAPVNVRQDDERTQGGNELSFFFPDLPLEIEDPVERLAAIVTSSNNAKELLAELGSRDISEIAKNIPPAYAAYFEMMSDVGSTMNSLVNHAGHSMVTNVPGQSFNMHLSGARLVDMTGLMMIFDGLGLNHVINSYAGKLYISPVSCPDMMPDMDHYAQCLRDSFTELHQQSCPPASKSKTAAAPKKPRASRAKTAKSSTAKAGSNTAKPASGKTAAAPKKPRGTVRAPAVKS